jgi:hypothetical protein
LNKGLFAAPHESGCGTKRRFAAPHFDGTPGLGMDALYRNPPMEEHYIVGYLLDDVAAGAQD